MSADRYAALRSLAPPPASPVARALLDEAETLTGALATMVERHPQFECLTICDSDGSEARLTLADLWQRGAVVQSVLTARGLRLGQLVEQAPVAAPAAPLPPPPPVGANPALLNRPVVEMELSVRSRKCLQRLGVNSIGELIQRSEPELLSIKNFGQTSLLEIKRRLTEMGLSLAQANR